MTLRIRSITNAVILDLRGDLIRGEPVRTLRTQVYRLLETGNKTLAVNMAEVSYLDSAGVGVLMSIHTTARASGSKCRFFALTPATKAVLKLNNLDKALDLYGDEATALASP